MFDDVNGKGSFQNKPEQNKNHPFPFPNTRGLINNGGYVNGNGNGSIIIHKHYYVSRRQTISFKEQNMS